MALLAFLIRRWVWCTLAILLIATLCIRVFTSGGVVTLLVVYTLAAVVGISLPRLAWRVIMRRHRDAFEREDGDELRRIARAIEPSLPAHAASLALSAMMVDERHEEVRERCRKALERALPKAHRALLNNALAWASAHAGEAVAAVPIAEAAVADATVLPPDQRALCVGTLGIVLVLACRPAEGLAHIESAISKGGTARAQAVRAYYAGEALRALGRAEDARVAYARAIESAPSSRWAARARAASDTLGVAYR